MPQTARSCATVGLDSPGSTVSEEVGNSSVNTNGDGVLGVGFSPQVAGSFILFWRKNKKMDYSDLWGFHRKRRRHRGVGVILGINTVGEIDGGSSSLSLTTVVDAVEVILVLVDIIATGTQ